MNPWQWWALYILLCKWSFNGLVADVFLGSIIVEPGYDGWIYLNILS